MDLHYAPTRGPTKGGFTQSSNKGSCEIQVIVSCHASTGASCLFFPFCGVRPSVNSRNMRLQACLAKRKNYGAILRHWIHDRTLGKSKKNLFKILYFSSVKVDSFVFEHFYFFLYRSSRCLSLKSTNPTGCGNNPVSGYLWRIGVFSHGLTDPPICPGFQGVSNFFIGRYAPFRHLP
jgi:hypothetical protein